MPDDLRELAREALLEITSAATVGGDAGETVEGDGVVSLYFECLLPGYPGWHWVVSVASIGDELPSVLEVELLPADGALLAPDWVPWSERLAEYKAAQAAATAAEDDDPDGDAEGDADADEADDADIDIDADSEDADDDEDVDDEPPVLHGGDLDGVDIDEYNEGDDEDDEDVEVADAEAEDAEDERP